jgi:hypothetical protein
MTLHDDSPGNPLTTGLPHREFFLDADLSWKAKGLLAFLLAWPDERQPPSVDVLATVSRDGRDSVAATMRELIDAGYVMREHRDGRFRWRMILRESRTAFSMKVLS